MKPNPFYDPQENCWVWDFPGASFLEYTLDEAGAIRHRIKGPAIAFKSFEDKSEYLDLYYINGKEYSRTDWLTITSYSNSEDQAAAISLLEALE